MQIEAKLFNEEGLNNLIVKQNSFWKSLLVLTFVECVLALERVLILAFLINYWELFWKYLHHLIVFELESTHNVLAS